MRAMIAAIVLGLICAAAPPAAAQIQGTSNTVPAPDPRAYADALSNDISKDNLSAVRDVFILMAGTTLSPELEGIIIHYRSYIGERQATSWTRLDDVILADRVRKIYYVHIFDANVLLFTRYDFVRADEAGWVLTGLTFGSGWEHVAVPLTPGFQPIDAAPARRR